MHSSTPLILPVGDFVTGILDLVFGFLGALFGGLSQMFFFGWRRY